jgi:hypothetical protein
VEQKMAEQNINEEVASPQWFKITAIVAIIWNLMGVIAFIAHVMMTPEMLAELSQAEQMLYKNTPAWALFAFALSVFAGMLGSIVLFMKKAYALIVLILSLIGVLVQMFHSFFMIDSIEVYGPGGMIMPIMVIIISIALVFIANKAKVNNWLS